MIKKIQNAFCLLITIIFISLTTTHYFSSQNINKINKSRAFYSEQISQNNYSIPLLENDTKNIIEYKNDVNFYKDKKKYNLFWNLIKKN